MKTRNIIIVIVVLLVVAGAAFGIVRFRQRALANNTDLQTYQIGYGDLSAVVDETGEVHADQSATLLWETAGVVDQVLTTIGEEVKAGQVLANIDENSLPQAYFLSQQEMINAQNALESLFDNADEVAANAQAAVAAAQDQLDDAQYRWTLNQPGNRYSPEEMKAAEARLFLARDQLQAKQDRFDNAAGEFYRAQAQLLLTAAINEYQQASWYVRWLKQGADEIEMAVLDSNLAVAEANLATAERRYEKVKDGPDPDDVKMAEARIAAAKAVLDTAFITAPFAGVITAVEVLPGDLVTPNTPAFRIDNLRNLLVDVGVSEVDINQISIGQPAILEFDAIAGKEYQGEVVNVSPIGIQQQGLVSFEVTIKVKDADEEVRPGLTAAVQIVVRQVDNALMIPNRAVRWVKGEQVVYIAKDPNNISENTLEKIPVTIGASSDEFSELIGGEIEEGDLIILNPPSVSIFEEMDGPPRGGF